MATAITAAMLAAAIALVAGLAVDTARAVHRFRAGAPR